MPRSVRAGRGRRSLAPAGAWLAAGLLLVARAAGAEEPVRYGCRTGREISAELRVRIEAAGRRALRWIAARRAEELFDAAHPLLRDSLPRQELASRLEAWAALVRRPAEARIGRLLLLDATGGRDRVWTVLCRQGRGPDPEPTVLHLKLADERVALAEFRMPGRPDGARMVLELREVAGGFGVADVEPRLASWLGRGAAFYVERARSRASTRPLLADLDYAVAAHLEGLGPKVSTPAERRIAALRRELRERTGFRRALRLGSSGGGGAVELLDLGVAVAGRGLVPRVAWRARPGAADQGAARTVRDRLLEAVPELAFEFGRVLVVPVGSDDAAAGWLLPLP